MRRRRARGGSVDSQAGGVVVGGDAAVFEAVGSPQNQGRHLGAGGIPSRSASSSPSRRRRFEVGALVLEAAGMSSRRARRPEVGGRGFKATASSRGCSPRPEGGGGVLKAFTSPGRQGSCLRGGHVALRLGISFEAGTTPNTGDVVF
jgi:hypothetical protein